MIIIKINSKDAWKTEREKFHMKVRTDTSKMTLLKSEMQIIIHNPIKGNDYRYNLVLVTNENGEGYLQNGFHHAAYNYSFRSCIKIILCILTA